MTVSKRPVGDIESIFVRYKDNHVDVYHNITALSISYLTDEELKAQAKGDA